MGSRLRPDVRVLGLGWLVAYLVLLYAFDMGRGFVKDDFGWILHSRLAGWRDVLAAFADPQGGFFRPLVALSFGIDERMFGLAPMAYALTNLAIVVATIAAVSVLGESLGLARPAGIVAAALWGLNFHGVPGALMWISGRTSLLTTLFAALAAIAVVRRRHLAGGALTFCALLSKEEPVLLPVIFAAWAVLDRRWMAMDQQKPGVRDIVAAIVRRAGPSFAALGAYLLLRSRSHAFTPSTAPSYYQLSVSPFVLVANAFQYLDRSCTFIAAVLLVSTLLFAQRRPRLNATERLLVVKGAVWLVLGFGVTILIPARSSLYVCFPSIGSALAGAAIGAAIWRDVPATRRRAAVVVLLLVPIVLLPAYRARNRRLREEATLSARVLSRIREARSAAGEIRGIVMYDQPAVHPSIASAFGDLLPDAVELTTGRRVPVDVRSSPPTAAERADPHSGDVLRFELTGGDVHRLF